MSSKNNIYNQKTGPSYNFIEIDSNNYILYFSAMKIKRALLAYFALMGAVVPIISNCIMERGTASVTKETIRLAIAVVFMLVAVGIFYKHKLGAGLRDTRFKAFLTKYPLVLAILPMLIGVTIGVLLTVLLP